MNDRIVVLEVSGLEALHLAGIVGQFRDLVVDAGRDDDPAVARLTPDAYPDDEDASREFRRLTGADMLDRRADDAQTVLHTLGMESGELDPTGDPETTITVAWERAKRARGCGPSRPSASCWPRGSASRTTMTIARATRDSASTTGSATASTAWSQPSTARSRNHPGTEARSRPPARMLRAGRRRRMPAPAGRGRPGASPPERPTVPSAGDTCRRPDARHGPSGSRPAHRPTRRRRPRTRRQV